MNFSLGTFSQDARRFAGLCLGERVIPLPAVHLEAARCGALWGQGASVLELLQDWERNLAVLHVLADQLSAQHSSAIDMASLHVHAPVDLPRQILCTGANYRKHVVDLTLDMGVGPEGLKGEALRKWAEDMMDERATTGEPYVFLKLPSAITGAFDPVVLPTTTQKPDWELELAVIIGRRARNVMREEALQYVAGYSIVNDVSARDLIARTDYKMLGTDWLRSKSPPTFMPFGPTLVPACFVPDPQNLRITLKLNGQTMQDESTADMLFDVARQIEYITAHVELWPGDLIATGSPAGNGTHYNRFLRPGDVMDAAIEGMGAQRNQCVQHEPATDRSR